MPAASLWASSAENDFYFSNPEKSADFSGLLFSQRKAVAANCISKPGFFTNWKFFLVPSAG
jgi:hypothetical protein